MTSPRLQSEVAVCPGSEVAAGVWERFLVNIVFTFLIVSSDFLVSKYPGLEGDILNPGLPSPRRAKAKMRVAFFYPWANAPFCPSSRAVNN